jgi:hypothetical protein
MYCPSDKCVHTYVHKFTPSCKLLLGVWSQYRCTLCVQECEGGRHEAVSCSQHSASTNRLIYLCSSIDGGERDTWVEYFILLCWRVSRRMMRRIGVTIAPAGEVLGCNFPRSQMEAGRGGLCRHRRDRI